MKQDTYNGMKRVNENVDYMQAFVTLSKDGIMINAGVNVKNYLIKMYARKDLFGILVSVRVNVINHVILENIQTMKVASVEKNQLINQLKSVLKMLKKKN